MIVDTPVSIYKLPQRRTVNRALKNLGVPKNSKIVLCHVGMEKFQFREHFLSLLDNEYRLRIISKRTLKEFWKTRLETKQYLLAWYKIVKESDWNNYNQLRESFASCKLIGKDRVIFKILGNKYRLVVKISFVNHIVWIRFIGSHQDYDKIDAKII